MNRDLFAPQGVMPGDVLDPVEVAADFNKAKALGSKLGPWQFLRNAFPDPDVFVKDGPVTLEGPCGATALLGTVPGTYPLLPDDVGADANLWKIPYNRGFHVIDDGGSGVMRLQWTSQYPEVIWPMYSLQYIRRDTSLGGWATFFVTGRIPRVNVRIHIDGALVPGTGPDVAPIDNVFRGGGLAVKAAALAAMGFVPLAPGPHTFEVLASQASAMNSSDEDTSEPEWYGDVGPEEGVCIGTRQGWVCRFTLGGML